MLEFYRKQAYIQNTPAKLFNKPPTLPFKQDRKTCPVDGNPLHVLNTKTRIIKTIGIGSFIGHHTIRYCPEHPDIGPFQSADLSKIVPPDSNFSYSVIVAIGNLRFSKKRQVQEIQQTMMERHSIEISNSEIEMLINRFIYYLAAVHQKDNSLIREYIRTQGGYILHLDATCKGDSPKLVSSMDAVSDFVLYSAKVKSENKDDLVKFLKEIEQRFGAPLAVMSDMGKGIEAAVKEVFGDVPHYICHFHFLKASGVMLFSKENKELFNTLSNAGISGYLKTKRRELRKKFGDTPIAEIENFFEKLEKHKKARFCQEMTTYYFLLWILDYASDGDSYGFPFDQSHLYFFLRLKEAYIMIEQIFKIHPGNRKKDRLLWNLYNKIKLVVEDSSTETLVERFKIKVAVFSDLREAFGTAQKSVTNGQSKRKQTTSVQELQRIKKAVEAFIKDLKKKSIKMNDKQITSAFYRLIDKVEEYGERLFTDPMIVLIGDREKIIIIQRTNNILEHHFMVFNYGCRRIHGNHSVRRNLENIPEQFPLVENLKNPNYVELIFGEKGKLAEKFAEVDIKVIRKMESDQKRRKQIYSSRKIKKTIRAKDFKMKLIGAFEKTSSQK